MVIQVVKLTDGQRNCLPLSLLSKTYIQMHPLNNWYWLDCIVCFGVFFTPAQPVIPIWTVTVWLAGFMGSHWRHIETPKYQASTENLKLIFFYYVPFILEANKCRGEQLLAENYFSLLRHSWWIISLQHATGKQDVSGTGESWSMPVIGGEDPFCFSILKKISGLFFLPVICQWPEVSYPFLFFLYRYSHMVSVHSFNYLEFECSGLKLLAFLL